HPLEQTRASAASALGRIGHEAVILPLVRALRGAAPNVRHQARAALQQIDHPDARRWLSDSPPDNL
ncbi:MAG: HEAT repeat domain-containing protein, partial [Candidatus Sericytochromatia bacterium]|nr:HEAT repeat domain-containing protein [Candidatus Sericytochromatia bacterium]